MERLAYAACLLVLGFILFWIWIFSIKGSPVWWPRLMLATFIGVCLGVLAVRIKRGIQELTEPPDE